MSVPAFAATITLYPVNLPDAQVGTVYSQVFSAAGGVAPYTFAVTSGNLPAGRPAFSLNPGGNLAGRPDGCNQYPMDTCANPEEPMTSSFVVTATDSRGLTGSRKFTIAVYWNPTKASYITALATAMSNVQAQIAGMPQPRIPLTGQHFPSNYNWLNTGERRSL